MEKWKIGAIVGAAWAAVSTISFSIFYSSVGKEPTSLGYKIIFSYVLMLESVTKIIKSGFSLTYALIYSYKYDFPTFLFIVVYLGLIGGAVGGEIAYLLDKIFQWVKSKRD